MHVKPKQVCEHICYNSESKNKEQKLNMVKQAAKGQRRKNAVVSLK